MARRRKVKAGPCPPYEATARIARSTAATATSASSAVWAALVNQQARPELLAWTPWVSRAWRKAAYRAASARARSR